MALTDEQLLEFDRSRLADFDENRAKRLLAEQGDAYRAQLIAARWIDGWRQRIAEGYNADPAAVGDPEAYKEGFDQALREVVAHLRQGDLVPGGVLHDEEWGRD